MIGRTRRELVVKIPLAAAAWMSPALAAPAAPAEPLEEPLRTLHRALETAMRSGRQTSFTQRFDALAPVVDRVFDLGTVLRVSVGARWDSMEADVRTRLFHAFRRFTTATYIAKFDRYQGERFVILPESREFGSDRVVATQIIDLSGGRVRVDYVMRDNKDAWRAVDVLLEGSISRVAVQRSDFRKILANGDADALIASLRRKTADLSDGALSL